ncbi:hypothetical protein GCM10011610_64280 [Nocardia rhizosphaerihabitans]|uniref:Uncharacterized protein n=1 Tax=Nocardia rhizosphaerihabitans TaxID=1691570 RepID=A0ABQ2KZL7_9NOCA|nr:hypothetical protein GCM10011610_64280 [Nocardia rhizosphaerihabitans]
MWLAARREPRSPERFRIDAALRVRLAYWRGNASALHRELRQRERDGGHRRRAVYVAPCDP